MCKSTSTNKNTQFKAIRFPHLIIEGIEKNLRVDESFSAWVKDACKEKIFHDNNHQVDKLMEQLKHAK